MKMRYLMLLCPCLLLCLSGRANAEILTLTIYAGAGTGGAVIFTQTGGTTTVNPNVLDVNAALTGAGFGAYEFLSLSGSSDNPGTSTPVGGFIQLSGQMHVTPGSPGEGTPITIALSEDGFTAPTAGNLDTATAADYLGTVAGSSQSDFSMFTDNTSMTVTGSPITLTSNGTTSDNHSGSLSQALPSYVSPYTLENVMTLNLTGSPTTAGSDGFVGTTSVVPAASGVPEPSSIILLGMGAVCSLGYGWRRRRQSA